MLGIANDLRAFLYDSVRKEIIGPDLGGLYVGHYKQQLNLTDQSELLLRDPHGAPWERYIAGKLYPAQYLSESLTANDESAAAVEAAAPSENSLELESGDLASSGAKEDTSTSDPISLANVREPSAFGFTIMVAKPKQGQPIKISFSCAFYKKGEGRINKLKQEADEETSKAGTPSILKPIRETEYWIRQPFFENSLILAEEDHIWDEKSFVTKPLVNEGERKVTLYINKRGLSAENIYTLTFTVVNESKENSENITYQNQLEVRCSKEVLVPYREKLYVNDNQDDERQMQLLYRDNCIYGVGHGCSFDWNLTEGDWILSSEFLPLHSIPLVAPGPDPESGESLDLAMWDLSDLGNWNNGVTQLKKLAEYYHSWIERTKSKIDHLDPIYRSAAINNIKKCETAYTRIKEGLDLLVAGSDVALIKSFKWMNRAMLWQQQRSKTGVRKWSQEGNRVVLEPLAGGSGKFSELEGYHLSSSKERPVGRWRPFQLAFVLMNLKAMNDPACPERDIVDLIWFPTGGGKTEAYLGLTAYSIFLRKLKNTNDQSTAILMRYTLRLLTSQQFERAASLLLGCNLIAREEGISGNISIGLWVGGDTTPNTNSDAVYQYEELQRGGKKYNFVLLKCPCCGAQIGPTELKGSSAIKGLYNNNGVVKFVCENQDCEFFADFDEDDEPSQYLPVYVIDDEIFENTPTLVLGTVDKFAMIPWKSQVAEKEKISRIFGFRVVGKRLTRVKPPELIIQDELHLIAGPLGSMVGMYEALVQTLCNDYKHGEQFFSEKYTAPKIVASSATITRAGDQIRNLYGIDKYEVFPAQGIDIGDTWFSYTKLNRTSDKRFYEEGRNYVGIFAPGKSAQQTIYKIYASVYQAIFESLDFAFPNGKVGLKELDYYWSLIGYFNSIRELGGALTLINGNFAEYLNRIRERRLLRRDQSRLRKPVLFSELTSRIPGHKIPETLKALELNLSEMPSKAMDICLATNMIATGLDVSRLGLMFVHGQPKTTAEYIQASSRVGRQFWEGPGLVFTLYSSQKPRDKSIYEHFRAYHSRLYSYVEPTSVTPFSIMVRERALHAVIIGLVRCLSSSYRYSPELQSNQELDLMFEWITKNVIIPRINVAGVDPDDYADTVGKIDLLKRRWKQDIYKRYGDAANLSINTDLAQVRRTFMAAMNGEMPEEAESAQLDGYCIPTPTSMRGVDGECVLKIPIHFQ